MLVKSLTASHVTIVETRDSGKRGMNPVVITIINTRKECWPSWGSNHRTLVLNPFPNKPWLLRVCSTSLLKTLWEKEKLLVTSNFSFSHSFFYSFENFLSPPSNSTLSSANSFGLEKSKICRLGKGYVM